MSRVLTLALILAAAGSSLPASAADGDHPIADDVTLATGGSVDADLLPDAGADPISLSRDSEGTVLRSFTIEGEDRVSIKFERPRISLDLDPRQAPGLGWKNSWDKLDVFPALTAQSAMNPPRFTGRPWLQKYAQDDVVVFHPEAPDMTSWKLTIVDSRGKPAVVRQGEGSPPASLAWNGRCDDGSPAWPGLIYSYVMETVDPAGNQRTFSGRGFGLPAYRLTGEQENLLVFAGSEIVPEDITAPTAHLPSEPLIVETASWLNQAAGLTEPIEIRATARSRRQGQQLAGLVSEALAGMICGDPARITTVVNVVADAPDQGVVEVASGMVR